MPWHTSYVAVGTQEVPAPMRISPGEAPAPGRGTAIAPRRGMHALEFRGEQLASDRPTIPVPAPRESGVRLKVERVAYAAATVDVVVCDLSCDPRSEDHAPVTVRDGSLGARAQAAHRSGFFPARARAAPRFGAFAVVVDAPFEDRDAAQNERPPSTSIVRALK